MAAIGVALLVALTLVSPAVTDRLLFLQIVWRHGDRAPTQTYPSDEHQEDAWPHGWGELTELGMKQQYALGRVIRNRYILNATPFLSPTYNAKEIYVRSTDVNRTLISAMANLAGLYPVGVPGSDFPRMKNSSWPSHWTPIPVHTVDADTDYILNAFAPCERANQLGREIEQSKPYREATARYKDFFEFLSEKTRMAVNLRNIFLINDAHNVEVLYNMSQPDWLTEQVAEKLQNVTEIADEFVFGISDPYVPELIKLRGGSLLKAILNNMKEKIECAESGSVARCTWMSRLKYIAFSAHDTTITALLSTFGDEIAVLHGGLPKYTASVAVELWNTSSGYAVKILYHSEFHHKYRSITHLTKGCPAEKSACPLDTFERRSAPFLPDDIKRDCAATHDNRTNRLRPHPRRHLRHKQRASALA